LAHYAQGAGIDELLSELRSGASVFYEQDALGSITSLSSLNSTVLGSYTYDTFGNTTALTGSFVNPYRYTGRDYDAEIGLQYSRARYFDSADGRFLSEDPARFSAGANFYSYVGNSPVSFYDPFGLAKYVLIVGQPGLGEHNIGRTFDIAAQTEAADLRAQGNDVTVVNAATVQGFNSALNSNGTIDGGVEYFGHSTYNALFIGQDTGPNTNLTFGNVSLLSNSHLGPDAVIALQGCFAGSGADESIAQAIANQLKRRVTAYPNSTFFAAGKCPKYTRPSDRAPNKPPARVCQQGGAPPLNFYPKK
jgi:RHS repeat-associated protein